MQEWIVVIGILGGSFITGILVFITNWLTKYYEEKKHRREIVLNAAIENWKNLLDSRTQRYIAKGDTIPPIKPLIAYIGYMYKFVDVISKKDTDVSELEEALKKAKEWENKFDEQNV